MTRRAERIIPRPIENVYLPGDEPVYPPKKPPSERQPLEVILWWDDEITPS